ncbi:MAG: DUF4373 domain-containing protein [Paraprevotella sp.]|nr:DUF4373 domain-containing protein [Paraprevotella sp.]
MKNYNFIPHAANTRSRSQVINLIEAEGAAGYGFYWALLEYLRAQKHYIGDIRSIKNIARQMKVRIDKALRILNNYGLFIVEEVDFHSPFLDEKMSPMKRKRNKNVSENDKTLSEVPCNTLEINGASFKEEKRKEETTTSSSKEDVADDDVIKQPWESYIDSLRHEEQWKEVMTIRSGPARILSAGSTRCCSTSSGTETQNAYISSSETPRRKNAPTAVSTYQLVRHLNQTTRRNGTKKQGIRGARKCRSKRNLGILQALNDDTTNAPTFF